MPIQLVGLLAKSGGVGPDRGLVLKALFAAIYFAAHDIQATCATLDAFVVDAPNGTKISQLTAAQLLLIAVPVEVALACQ